MLSPLLYSLFTHDCTARQDSNTIIKFADDTSVVGVITDNNKTAYREEVRDLAGWCQDNNFSLNVIKTKGMIVDYRKCTHHCHFLLSSMHGHLHVHSTLINRCPRTLTLYRDPPVYIVIAP